jgi:DNA mismatch endonuclease (patch repair protein)
MKKLGWRPAPQRKYRPRTAAKTSAIMASIRGRNNKAEVALRKTLWRRGLRYRLYDRKIPGSPDLVFVGSRVVVYVDGDFWHGRAMVEGGVEALSHVFRTERRDYWIGRIKRNVARDERNRKMARKLGWHVVRLWERDILNDVPSAAALLEGIVRKRLRPKRRRC